MPETVIEFTPTEPVPTTAGSPMTYEQGERLIKDIEQFLVDYKTNTEATTKLTTDNQTALTKLLTDNQTANTKLITDNQTANVSKMDEINQILTDIKNNTTPKPIDETTNPSGTAMTYEQGQVLLDKIDTLEQGALVLIVSVFVVFVVKHVYKTFAGIFFGGL